MQSNGALLVLPSDRAASSAALQRGLRLSIAILMATLLASEMAAINQCFAGRFRIANAVSRTEFICCFR